MKTLADALAQLQAQVEVGAKRPIPEGAVSMFYAGATAALVLAGRAAHDLGPAEALAAVEALGEETRAYARTKLAALEAHTALNAQGREPGPAPA